MAAAKSPQLDSEPIHIANAGLALVSAFLPHLLRRLDFIVADETGHLGWALPELRDRAVHLLQFLVDERRDGPEQMLALNKLLCGMHPSEAITAAIVPTDAEREACAQLLAAVLANWPPLRSSSSAALRGTWLQRDGRLAASDNGWTLDVEGKAVDILVDQIPWGFSTIHHPWMNELLSVRWGSG
jgi:hypothetical protein